MSDWGWVAKAVGDFGVIGLGAVALVLFYRLVDKYMAASLETQRGLARAMTEQAGAMTGLAQTVKDGQNDQREVLIAVRVLADKMDRQERYLESIEQRMDANCRRCGKEAA